MLLLSMHLFTFHYYSRSHVFIYIYIYMSNHFSAGLGTHRVYGSVQAVISIVTESTCFFHSSLSVSIQYIPLPKKTHVIKPRIQSTKSNVKDSQSVQIVYMKCWHWKIADQLLLYKCLRCTATQSSACCSWKHSLHHLWATPWDGSFQGLFGQVHIHRCSATGTNHTLSYCPPITHCRFTLLLIQTVFSLIWIWTAPGWGLLLFKDNSWGQPRSTICLE